MLDEKMLDGKMRKRKITETTRRLGDFSLPHFCPVATWAKHVQTEKMNGRKTW